MNYIQYINFTLRDDSEKYQDLPSQNLVYDATRNISMQSNKAPSSIAKGVKRALQNDAAKLVTVGGQNI